MIRSMIVFCHIGPAFVAGISTGGEVPDEETARSGRPTAVAGVPDE